jgi:hypothetical protein
MVNGSNKKPVNTRNLAVLSVEGLVLAGFMSGVHCA